jgi:putative ABC transport system permease protein
VGVVADVKSAGLDQAAPVQVFGAFYQEPAVIASAPPSLTVLARTAREPGPVAAPMRQAVLDVDRSQPVHGIQAMTEIVGQSIEQRRLALTLLGFFAASALVLAAIGVYGVMSFVVTQRTGEIGIRMALGADASQVAWLVQRQGMTLAVAGLAIGTGGAMLLTRFLGTMLFHVGERDPMVFGGAAAALAAVSAVACWLPARRASRVDPIVALRRE